ncbi:hypothetical protein B9Z55_019943 [Caenorhabditis nigoni]|nr:hypothetical protein B9Z55_019943 [Caenorhabditis nigoni]
MAQVDVNSGAYNQEEDYDDNSSARLFERSRIQALATSSETYKTSFYDYDYSTLAFFSETLVPRLAQKTPRVSFLPYFL